MPHGYMRHPPVRRVPWVTSKKRLEDMSWDVHDLGAHSEEDLGGLVLREEVREVVDGVDVWDDDFPFLDHFADVEVAARDVLRALVELRVVGEVVRRLVVAVQRCGREWGVLEFGELRAVVDDVLGGLGGGDDLSVGGGGSDALLRLGAVGDDRGLPRDEPAGGGAQDVPVRVEVQLWCTIKKPGQNGLP